MHSVVSSTSKTWWPHGHYMCAQCPPWLALYCLAWCWEHAHKWLGHTSVVLVHTVATLSTVIGTSHRTVPSAWHLQDSVAEWALHSCEVLAMAGTTLSGAVLGSHS